MRVGEFVKSLGRGFPRLGRTLLQNGMRLLKSTVAWDHITLSHHLFRCLLVCLFVCATYSLKGLLRDFSILFENAHLSRYLWFVYYSLSYRNCLLGHLKELVSLFFTSTILKKKLYID